MDGWTRETGETEYLGMQDLRTLITARDKLTRRGFVTLLDIFDDFPAQDCTKRATCGTSLGGLVRSVEWDHGHYAVLDSWEVEIKRLAKERDICKRCRDALLKRDVAERREVWWILPSMFKLSAAGCRWNTPVAGDESSSDSDSDWA